MGSGARALPTRESTLRETTEFILSSPLGRAAQACTGIPRFAVFLMDMLADVYRLEQSCHLAEFTDHGLTHINSLVDRVSRWTTAPHGGSSAALLDSLDPRTEAPVLLLALIWHDIGMLSQRVDDLPPGDHERLMRGVSQVADWVRRTHVDRLGNLVRHLIYAGNGEHAPLLGPGTESCHLVERAIAVAKAHACWPWDAGFTQLPERDSGLAAAVAVADLLDEDSYRCDSVTLIAHRQGTPLNVAHWLRHSLTTGRLLVVEGRAHVRMLRPPLTDIGLAPVFAALRNQLRLALFYNAPLRTIGAGMLAVEFDPPSGAPTDDAPELGKWWESGYTPTQEALCYHLLTSFMPEALADSRTLSQAPQVGLEPVDLALKYHVEGRYFALPPVERVFRAMWGGTP